MKNYIVEVSSREQFQSVIDYVGTNTDNNRFDAYEGNVFIYVEDGGWSYSDSDYYNKNKDETQYDGVPMYSFSQFKAFRIFGSPDTPTFATHAQEVDMINSPSHYNQFSREVIDTMKGMSTPEEFKGFLKLNAVKYLSRYQGKNGAEDLDKAIWYIERLKSEISEQL